MRMATKIRDYYDGVIRSTMNDKSFTFVREPREIGMVDFRLPHTIDAETSKDNITIEFFIVGFCGKIYPGISACRSSKFYGYETYIKPVTVYFYDWEEAKKFIPFDRMGSRWDGSRKLFSIGSDKAAIEAWLVHGRSGSSWYRHNTIEAKTDPKITRFFMDERVAYFKVTRESRRGRIIVDAYPILKDVGFYKVFDSYTGFQQIENFLTNELVKPDEIKQEIQESITDELKVQAHGYDKWSFRKEPQKKERRK